MNKKDYDTIAKIIKNNTAPEENRFNDLSVVGDCLIEDLADYFEEEDTKNQPTKDIWNRKQFIKDCGV